MTATDTPDRQAAEAAARRRRVADNAAAEAVRRRRAMAEAGPTWWELQQAASDTPLTPEG